MSYAPNGITEASIYSLLWPMFAGVRLDTWGRLCSCGNPGEGVRSILHIGDMLGYGVRAHICGLFGRQGK